MTDLKKRNALHWGVYSDDIDIVKMIIEHGVNINSRIDTGESALHISCNRQTYDIAQLLIKNHVNVEFQDYDNGYTALHYCVSLNNLKLTQLLINNKSNVNLQDSYGRTIMHYITIENSIKIFESIIINKNIIINPNLYDMYGKLPLHFVLENLHINSDVYIDFLLPTTNINFQDNNGNTCLHHITKNNLWKTIGQKLSTKKLDIFLHNKKSHRPIDFIDKSDIDEFMDIVIDSYYYQLQQEKESLWNNDWENLCSTSMDLTRRKECLKHIKTKLNKLMKDDKYQTNDQCFDKSYPIKKNHKCIIVSEGPKINMCTFTGNTLDMLIGLIMLLKKHPKQSCSPFDENFVFNESIRKFNQSKGITTTSIFEFLNYAVIWSYNKIFFINNFEILFDNCKRKSRFIIIQLGIETSDAEHCNYLIYDRVPNEIERFEPNGSDKPYGISFNPSIIDDILEKKFREIDSTIKYVKPSDYLPKIGFQFFDAYESNNKQIGDPSGFCGLWSIWYADMRMTYYDIDRKMLVELIINYIKSNNISFKNLIRNYSHDIVELRDSILNKATMTINDWLTDQYTPVQLQIVIDNIKIELR